MLTIYKSIQDLGSCKKDVVLILLKKCGSLQWFDSFKQNRIICSVLMSGTHLVELRVYILVWPAGGV